MLLYSKPENIRLAHNHGLGIFDVVNQSPFIVNYSNINIVVIKSAHVNMPFVFCTEVNNFIGQFMDIFQPDINP